MDIAAYLKYSPYDAALFGKEGEERDAVLEKLGRLPKPVHSFLTAPETAEHIADMVARGVVSDAYVTAVGKIIFMVCTKEVPAANIPDLLVRIGLDTFKAQQVGQELTTLLEPVLKTRPAPTPAPTMRPLPTLTRPSQSGPQSVAGQSGPGRNIIDLRKQQ